jgi:hypothetical protein
MIFSPFPKFPAIFSFRALAISLLALSSPSRSQLLSPNSFFPSVSSFASQNRNFSTLQISAISAFLAPSMLVST